MSSPFKKASLMEGENYVNKVATFLNQQIVKTHYCHHNTTCYSCHKALDFLYDGLNELKDEVIEKCIGYPGQRYNRVDLIPISGDPEMLRMSLGNEVIAFANALEDWGEEYRYGDITNLAQSLSGVGAKYNYLITLKG